MPQDYPTACNAIALPRGCCIVAVVNNPTRFAKRFDHTIRMQCFSPAAMTDVLQQHCPSLTATERECLRKTCLVQGDMRQAFFVARFAEHAKALGRDVGTFCSAADPGQHAWMDTKKLMNRLGSNWGATNADWAQANFIANLSLQDAAKISEMLADAPEELRADLLATAAKCMPTNHQVAKLVQPLRTLGIVRGPRHVNSRFSVGSRETFGQTCALLH